MVTDNPGGNRGGRTECNNHNPEKAYRRTGRRASPKGGILLEISKRGPRAIFLSGPNNPEGTELTIAGKGGPVGELGRRRVAPRSRFPIRPLLV